MILFIAKSPRLLSNNFSTHKTNMFRDKFITIRPDSNNNNNENAADWKNAPATPSSFTSPTESAIPTSDHIQRAQNTTRNVLNSDVEVKGKLRFTDDLLIDGTVEGEIQSEGILSVGQNAVIKAEISTKSVIVHGKVLGNITVTDRVELKSTAELVGDIQAASLAIESGAVFIGRSAVGSSSIASLSAQASIPTPAAPVVETTLEAEPTLDLDEEV